MIERIAFCNKLCVRIALFSRGFNMERRLSYPEKEAGINTGILAVDAR